MAGPEAANNAAAGGALIPLLSLGIPMNATVALLFAALMIHGVRPGPMLIAEHPEVFWGIVASMYIGNVMLLILNLPLIGMWVKVLKIPYRIIFPMIILFCIIGVYAINLSTMDLSLMLGFGVLGYLMRKFGFDPAPLCLAFILGPLLEVAMRQSLLLSQGHFAIFFTRPLSAICLGIAALLLLTNLLSFLKQRRSEDRINEEAAEKSVKDRGMESEVRLSKISTASAVVNYIKKRIEDGLLKPGEKLPSERLLQQELAVSRFTLREALARLSALGIIKTIHGKGTIVAREVNSATLADVFIPLFVNQSIKDVVDFFEARLLIESEAAVLSARRQIG